MEQMDKDQIRDKIEKESDVFMTETYAIIRLQALPNKGIRGIFLPNVVWRFDKDKTPGEFTKENVIKAMAESIYDRMQEGKMFLYKWGFFHLRPIPMYWFTMKLSFSVWWSNYKFRRGWYPKWIKEGHGQP